MKKTLLSVVFDTIFTFFSVGLIVLCFLRYFGVKTPIAALLAVFAAAAASGGVYLLLFSAMERRNLKGKDEETKNKLMLHLTLSEEGYVLSLMKSLCGDPYQISASTLVYRNERIVPLFTMQPASADDVAYILKRFQRDKITVWCNDLSPEAKNLCARLHISVVYGANVYLNAKKAGLLPEKYLCEEYTKRTFSDRLKIYFAKANSRPFFLCGTGLLILSLFTFFPLYYMISGSVLTIAALFVRLFGYEKKI